MLSLGGAPARVFDLYVKLSAWLVPTFLVCALTGLHLLSSHVVSSVESQVSMRVGNLSGRVAGALEAISYDPFFTPRARDFNAQHIMQTLMSDVAIECAELRVGAGAHIQVPAGLGCLNQPGFHATRLPVFFGAEASLLVRWSDHEVIAGRQQQREISMIILLVGLLVALIANWLALRVIIGKPLTELIERIDSARRNAEHSSLHDPLTDLANRRYLDHELTERIETGDQIQVLHLDLDGFKTINDTSGHSAGDHVLQHVAKVLRGLAKDGDLVARVGGDEFVMLLAKEATLGRATGLACPFRGHPPGDSDLIRPPIPI